MFGEDAKPVRKEVRDDKLAANWDDPFRTINSFQNGVINLNNLVASLSRTWDATHLKMHYS